MTKAIALRAIALQAVALRFLALRFIMAYPCLSLYGLSSWLHGCGPRPSNVTMQIQFHLDIRWVDRGLTFRLHCDMHAPPRRRPSPTRISHCSSEDQIGLASSSHIITAVEQEAYCAVSLCRPDHGTAPLLCMPSVDRQNDLRG